MQEVVTLLRRDGLEGLFAALGLTLEQSELQICLTALGKRFDDSFPRSIVSVRVNILDK